MKIFKICRKRIVFFACFWDVGEECGEGLDKNSKETDSRWVIIRYGMKTFSKEIVLKRVHFWF